MNADLLNLLPISRGRAAVALRDVSFSLKIVVSLDGLVTAHRGDTLTMNLFIFILQYSMVRISMNYSLR